MSDGVSHALEQALAYYRAPALLAKAVQRPLPDDVIELLRLAAGDAAQAAQSAEASGESAERVVDAAVFFVQQVMFAADAPAHRVLGVNPGAPAARIREHFRWLIRWLHPDRNPDDWDSVYTDRVTRAWQSLRRSGALAGEGEAGDADMDMPLPEPAVTAEARQALTVLAAARMARISRQTQAAPAEPIISARTARALPGFVLGGLTLAAVSLVALLWYAQQDQPTRVPRVGMAPAELPSAQADPVPEEDSFALASRDALQAMPAPDTDASTPDPFASQPPMPDPLTVVADAAPPPGPLQAPPAANTRPRNEAPGSAQYAAQPTAKPPAPPSFDAPQTSAPITSDAVVTAPREPRSRPVAVEPSVPSMSPAVSEPVTVPAAIPASAIDEGTAHALLQQFSTAYAAGDIHALMRLFTRDASNNRGGREAIAYDYQSLFSSTRERRLSLQPNGWFAGNGEGVVLANYEAWVREGRLLPGSTSRGKIRFTVRREDGVLKISRLNHD